MPLIILLFFFALSYTEFKLISAVYGFLVQRYDAVSAVFLILLSFLFAVFLGARLIRLQGGKLLEKLKSGQVQGKDSIRSFLALIAGILFIIPGYLSDVFALICLFPPTAWVMNKLLLNILGKLMTSSRFRFYSNLGNSSQGPFGNAQAMNRKRDDDPTIIDVDAFDSPQKLL